MGHAKVGKGRGITGKVNKACNPAQELGRFQVLNFQKFREEKVWGF